MPARSPGQTLGASGNLSGSTVVGSGVEFSVANFFEFDFSSDGELDLLSNGRFAGSSFSPGAFVYTFTDINGTITDIVGVRLIGQTSGVHGFDASMISYSAESVTLT